MKLSVGTDAEFFLETQEGSLVAAPKFIEGSKTCPTILSNGGNVTYDNVALEFATPPVESEEDFVKAVKDTLKEALSFLPNGIRLNLSPSANFPEDELSDEKCRRFGCEPDYDAWELKINSVDPEAVERPFRSCGGHLHIGYIEDSGNDFLHDPYGKVAVVKALDIVAGIPSVILDGSKASIERRKLYGKAGCHRPTSYGVEYRTLSNFWATSPERVRMVYSMAADALRLVREDKLQKLSDSITEKEIIRVINEGDIESAQHLWDSVIKNEVSENTVKLFDTCKNVGAVTSIYKTWKL